MNTETVIVSSTGYGHLRKAQQSYKLAFLVAIRIHLLCGGRYQDEDNIVKSIMEEVGPTLGILSYDASVASLSWMDSLSDSFVKSALEVFSLLDQPAGESLQSGRGASFLKSFAGKAAVSVSALAIACKESSFSVERSKLPDEQHSVSGLESLSSKPGQFGVDTVYNNLESKIQTKVSFDLATTFDKQKK